MTAGAVQVHVNTASWRSHGAWCRGAQLPCSRCGDPRRSARSAAGAATPASGMFSSVFHVHVALVLVKRMGNRHSDNLTAPLLQSETEDLFNTPIVNLLSRVQADITEICSPPRCWTTRRFLGSRGWGSARGACWPLRWPGGISVWHTGWAEAAT